MDRRSFFRGLLALPIAAVAAPLATLAPKPFESGGLVPQGTPYLVGQHRTPCFAGVDVSPHRSAGHELVIHVRCDMRQFEADLQNMERSLRRIIALKRDI